MWKSVLAGIILENIETLRHYQIMKDKKTYPSVLIQDFGHINIGFPFQRRND